MTRPLLVAVGTVSLALGIAGIFLPLLPTTPFLLLASACYARSNERLHQWLLNHGRLGAYIRAFEEGRGLPVRAKVLSIAVLWASMGYTLYVVSSPWGRAGLVALGLGVTFYLLRLPTLKKVE